MSLRTKHFATSGGRLHTLNSQRASRNFGNPRIYELDPRIYELDPRIYELDPRIYELDPRIYELHAQRDTHSTLLVEYTRLLKTRPNNKTIPR